MGLPIPDLDDKTFQEIAEEARTLLLRYAPEEWTDHNIHDPGITFLELFAWLAEMQIYHLNQVSDEHYQKFLELTGYTLHGAQPASTYVTFTFPKGTENSGEILPACSQISTVVNSEKIIFETEEEVPLIPGKLIKVITAYESKTFDNSLANETDDIHFAPFGEKATRGAEIFLGFDREFPKDMMIHLSFFLFEGDLPPVGSHGEESNNTRMPPSVKLEWSYLRNQKWETLLVVKDTTRALNRSGTIVLSPPPCAMDKVSNQKIVLDPDLTAISIQWIEKENTNANNGNYYWIRCELVENGYEIVPQINRIFVNTVSVRQIETTEVKSARQIETTEVKDLGKGTGYPDQKISLKDILFLSEVTHQCEMVKDGLLILVEDEKRGWKPWKMVENFEKSGPNDPHFILDLKKGEILFGNGLNGKIPPELRKIGISNYQTTLGSKGNISKGLKNWRIEDTKFRELSGVNHIEAKGGKDAEDIKDAKARVRKDFRTSYRAVTSDDFEKLALSTPGLRVARAKAIPNYHPDFPCIKMPGAVTVVVVPYTRGTDAPEPGKSFLDMVSAHLNAHRLVTTNVFVMGPEYVKIAVQCKVRVRKTYTFDAVQKSVEQALKNFLNPVKRVPEENEWAFGRPVFFSEIYQKINEVKGVDYVTIETINAETKNSVVIPPTALVYSKRHPVGEIT